MLRGIRKDYLTVSVAFCIAVLFSATVALSADAAYKITANDASLNDGILTYTLTGSAKPSYTIAEKSNPLRVVMEVNGAEFSVASANLPENEFVTMTEEALSGANAPGKRLIFTLGKGYGYDIVKSGKSVQIIFAPVAGNGEKKEDFSETAMQSVPKVVLQEFQVVSTPGKTTVSLLADKELTDFTVDTQESPGTIPNMYIDIKSADYTNLTREKIIGSRSLARVRAVPKGDGVRLIFESAIPRLFTYKVNGKDNGLDIVIDENASQRVITDTRGRGKGDDRLGALISSTEKLAASGDRKKVVDKFGALAGDFASSGYGAQRITVDFYKIDIHNVFRLFREITDLNIIVDEGCQGSLTLALNDVPWDFALDIILNLMQFKQERRFNTIVIYPGGKEFVWPKHADDNLAIRPDMKLIKQDSLIIEKTATQTKEVLKAKELLVKAQLLEQQKNYDDALVLYEKAHTLWPKNSRISNRIASIYLVELGQNAKALQYAASGLRYKPQDYKSALYAAIASANMKQLPQANEYFKRAINGKPPLKEALLSYAAFSENHGKNTAALKLLDKYKRHYGDNMNTMLARARMYDKGGKISQAKQEYRALLNSGYKIPADLRRYVQYRIAGAE